MRPCVARARGTTSERQLDEVSLWSLQFAVGCVASHMRGADCTPGHPSETVSLRPRTLGGLGCLCVREAHCNGPDDVSSYHGPWTARRRAHIQILPRESTQTLGQVAQRDREKRHIKREAYVIHLFKYRKRFRYGRPHARGIAHCYGGGSVSRVMCAEKE